MKKLSAAVIVALCVVFSVTGVSAADGLQTEVLLTVEEETAQGSTQSSQNTQPHNTATPDSGEDINDADINSSVQTGLLPYLTVISLSVMALALAVAIFSLKNQEKD